VAAAVVVTIEAGGRRGVFCSASLEMRGVAWSRGPGYGCWHAHGERSGRETFRREQWALLGLRPGSPHGSFFPGEPRAVAIAQGFLVLMRGGLQGEQRLALAPG